MIANANAMIITPVTVATVYFFVLEYACRRSLHSFPTRRSSDLKPESLNGLLLENDAAAFATERLEATLRIKAFRRERRSEEHTSELQSLAYLVCRLLLEKKKKKNKKL